MKYEAVIGLEIHVQLNTKSKIFCSCSTEFTVYPNTQVCEICQGHPGVLPVLNEEVVNKAIQVGLALDCKINEQSRFDRKHYFYPDLPKGYQITQYNFPICQGGYIEVDSLDQEIKNIGIHRIHIEEDAGKLIHGKDVGLTYIDFNRCGMPLLEIVTEADIRFSEQAREYLNDLKSILRYINVSDCNMEEGSLRCDVNISLREKQTDSYGTKVEIKNLNSFKAVKKSIDFEIKRQSEVLDRQEAVIQETRLYNMDEDRTTAIRSKEEAQDYRYFPEPDLLPLYIKRETIDFWAKRLGELPKNRFKRFQRQYGLKWNAAKILISRRDLADYFESVMHGYSKNPIKVANWVTTEVLRVFNESKSPTLETFQVSPKSLACLIQSIDEGNISGKMAKKIFDEMANTSQTVEEVIRRLGLNLLNDATELLKVIQQVINENPKVIDSYKNGKTQVVGYLVGQIMKKTQGQANPQKVQQLLKQKLS